MRRDSSVPKLRISRKESREKNGFRVTSLEKIDRFDRNEKSENRTQKSKMSFKMIKSKSREGGLKASGGLFE